MGGSDEAMQPLFVTKQLKGRFAYRCFASTIFLGICLILVYRLKHIPSSEEHGSRWAWIGLFMAELWFGFYWIITQSVRWNVIYRIPFKDRLLQRYGRDELPAVDVFVCTADPTLEPPALVVNTVLSAMAYNYPTTEKLSVYLSDDGGSELTFYAVLEASGFAKRWIPFCKKFKVEPRSPQAFFLKQNHSQDITFSREHFAIKKLYEEMKNRIQSVVEMGSIPKEVRDQHKGFSEWDSKITKKEHQSIVQILIDGRDTESLDSDGNRLPTLVYMSREKKPQVHHNFKAGSMNAMIRVSSEMSNGDIILNLDCDMYPNDPDAIMDALCFFLDEEKGQRISYVQYPQYYNNIHKSNIYSCSSMVVTEIELAGVDGYGGALYCGTGCFHRRESLCGRKYSEDFKAEWNSKTWKNAEKTVQELEEASKVLATCSYEKGTLWGKEMGLMYGGSVEDIVTGLAIQCKGWEPVHYNPQKRAFLGVAATTLDQALIQYKRWAEGMFQIFITKYCPFFYGHGKIKLGAQMGYCVYLLWAPNSFPMLYYTIIPPLFLLHGVALFPQVSSPWFLPFAYVFTAKYSYSMLEALWCGDSFKAWWNLERTWLFRSSTSYLFAFIDNLRKQLGLSETTFDITDKVVDEGVLKRYQQEIMEFGNASLMVSIISTLALLNLFSLFGGMMRIIFIIFSMEIRDGVAPLSGLIPHNILCGMTVMLNLPVYHALFIRSDKGRIPSSVMFMSVVLASLPCLLPFHYSSN